MGAVEPVSLESRGGARAENIDLGVVRTSVVFKVMDLGEIT